MWHLIYSVMVLITIQTYVKASEMNTAFRHDADDNKYLGFLKFSAAEKPFQAPVMAEPFYVETENLPTTKIDGVSSSNLTPTTTETVTKLSPKAEAFKKHLKSRIYRLPLKFQSNAKPINVKFLQVFDLDKQ